MPPYALTPRNIQIRDNFDAIAPRYDLTNRVISFGADLSRAMLGLARRKLAAGAAPVTLVNAPAEALPFRDASFDAVTIAFGIRNVPDFVAGLKEMLRVLRRGGRACILEFSTPPSRLWWKVYNYYFFNILPRIGGLITGREAAYRYLTDSVALFPDAGEFKTAMEEAGFAQVSYLSMNGGIVCVHTGVRP